MSGAGDVESARCGSNAGNRHGHFAEQNQIGIRSGKMFSCVITACDEASAERCPIFPGVTKRLQWSFPDPSKFEGTHDERLTHVREVREAITDRIQEWCNEVSCVPAAG